MQLGTLFRRQEVLPALTRIFHCECFNPLKPVRELVRAGLLVVRSAIEFGVAAKLPQQRRLLAVVQRFLIQMRVSVHLVGPLGEELQCLAVVELSLDA